MKIRLSTLLCVFLIILHCHSLQGQNQQKIDSLKLLVQTAENDSSKIVHSIGLYRVLVKSDTTEALKFLDQSIDLSRTIKNNDLLCQSFLTKCNHYWKRGNLELARAFLLKVEKRLPEVTNKEIVAKYYMEKAIISHRAGQYANAITKFLEARSLYESLQDTLAVSKCHTNIGGSYWEMNQPEEALENYLKAMNILESMQETNEVSVSSILGNIGLIYRQRNQFSEALVYYQKSLELNIKNNMKMSEAINLQNIGSLYSKTKHFEKALPYFQEAKRVALEIDDKIGVLYANHSIGNHYNNIGDYAKGIPILKDNLLLAKKLNSNEEIKNLNRDISEAYEKSGSFEKALSYRKVFELWNDSLTDTRHLQKVKDLELKYETSKKDKEITVLTKENELQVANAEKEATLRKALIGGLVALVMIGLLLFNTMRQRLKNQKVISAKNEQINKAKLSEELQTLEMKALRAQMNPHFLFNSLNSINTMILNDENEGASRYLSKFSKLVRLLLENSEQPTVSLKDEMDMLETYIQLESLRFNNKLEYQIMIEQTVDQDSTLIPSMVMQPFVENAIWHGLLHKDSKGLLSITIIEEDNKLLCSIIDNGVGREKSVTLKKEGGLKKKSMGIKITADRLKILTKQKIQDVINIIDLKDDNQNALGTQVNIQIPIA